MNMDDVNLEGEDHIVGIEPLRSDRGHQRRTCMGETWMMIFGKTQMEEYEDTVSENGDSKPSVGDHEPVIACQILSEPEPRNGRERI